MAKLTGMQCEVRSILSPVFCDLPSWIAMTAAQSRIGETVDIFYGVADRTSDGALAGHAYKRSVDDLDTSFSREMVCHRLSINSQHQCIRVTSRMHPIALQFPSQWGKCAHTSQS